MDLMLPQGKVLGRTSPPPSSSRLDADQHLMSNKLLDRLDQSEGGPRDQTDRGRVVVFIDGANLFYAAAHLGIGIDYLKLLQHLVVNGRLLHAFFYTGVDPTNDKQHKFLLWMQRNGYRVITKPITQFMDGSKKANLDVEIAVDMVRLANYLDTAVLVSGDGDFTYVVNMLAYQGVRVEVVGLRSMTSDQLISAADYYTDIEGIQQSIQKLKPVPSYSTGATSAPSSSVF
jgi:uncharacterized LabA/DUF88 family protein